MAAAPPASEAVDFEAVYLRHAAGVYRFCVSQLRDPHLAEDVAADTFARAFAAWERVRPDAAGVRPWLFRIARNAAVDVGRRRRRGRRALAALAPSPAPDVETVAALRGELRAVVAAVAALPRRQRQLVGLRVAAGLPFAEVAAVLGIREQAAKVATHRALARVRSRVDSEVGR